MPSPEEETEFYFWEYDDGTEAGVAIDIGSEFVQSSLLPKEDKGNLHAPILACNFKDGVNDWIERVVASVGIDTTNSILWMDTETVVTSVASY